MSPEAFEDWAAHSRRGFADQQVASGTLPPEEAAAEAARGFADLLPDGLDTPSHHLFTVHETCERDVVGHLWLRVRAQPETADEVEGYVFDVELLPVARGRGLGRATMLAAEDAARDLGATVMRLNVFGHNTTAMRLYESLGYTVTSAAMQAPLEELPSRVPGGPAVVLRDMTQEEYDVFRPRLEAGYGSNIAAAGAMPEEEARRTAREQLDRLLPDGRDTPGHLLWTALDGEEPVGVLWLHLRPRSDGLQAFGFELEVREELRRQGYARAVLAAAAEACRELGVTTVALSVFGFNAGARTLYEQMGFRLSAQNMVKALGPSPESRPAPA